MIRYGFIINIISLLCSNHIEIILKGLIEEREEKNIANESRWELITDWKMECALRCDVTNGMRKSHRVIDKCYVNTQGTNRYKDHSSLSFDNEVTGIHRLGVNQKGLLSPLLPFSPLYSQSSYHESSSNRCWTRVSISYWELNCTKLNSVTVAHRLNSFH